jgi:hypothetical protein
MITQTIEQLQELGFHCNNFIRMRLPADMFNVDERQFVGMYIDNSTSNRYKPIVVTSYEITPETIKLINNSELVAWYPKAEPNDIRIVILDNFIS